MPRRWALKNVLGRISSLLLLIAISASGANSSGYFQQEVFYTIHVRLNPDLVRLDGRETITYINHSPDTLSELYFYLYFNKYQAHSFYNPQRQSSLAYTEVRSIRTADGTPLPFSVNNTIMHVPLQHHPLAPGDTLQFTIRFVSVLPPRGSRFGYAGDHYDVGNWYPVPAVYDRFGWHVDQHLRGEFYQEWGHYDVYITVPSDFVVTATGQLQNPEVLPDSVDYPDRTIAWLEQEEPDTITVTYHFVADRVHDFAWCADPEFFRIQRQVGSITVDFYLLPYQKEAWQEAIEAGVEAVRYYQEIIGPYPYKHLSVVDGFITAGGIEYPNLVIINDAIRNPRSIAITVIHEIAHQWFYGLLGNNQTRYGWMDEGFTTFLETLCTEHIWGKNNNLPTYQSSFWSRWFGYERNALHDVRLNYLEYALSGNEEPINTHFDYFQHNPYIPYYDKTAAVLFALKDMLGDSLFFHALQHYYWQWRFRHPYPQDMIRSFEEATGTELNWFFDQWFNTTWRCDIAVKGYRGHWVNGPNGREYELEVHLRREEPIAMPVMLKATLQNGSVKQYRIPVAGWLRDQKSPGDLPPWHISNREYVTTLHLPEKIRSLEIANATAILDINPFNNSDRAFPPIRWHFLHRQYYQPHLDAYTVTLFPFAFYNDVDGLKIGLRTTGNFIADTYQHTLQLLVGTRQARPSIAFDWASPLSTRLPDLEYHLGFERQDGLESGFLEIKKRYRERLRYRLLMLGWQYRRLYDDAYRLVEWSPGRENLLYVLYSRQWRRSRWSLNGERFHFLFQTSFFGSRFLFQKWQIEWERNFSLFRNWNFSFLLKAGSITGTPPVQQRFYLAQAAPGQWSRNPFYRARGLIRPEWMQKGHIFLPGGGHITSALFENTGSETVGNHLLHARITLNLWNPFERLPWRIPILRDLYPLAFFRLAEVWEKKFHLENLVGEWGIALNLRSPLPLPFRYFSLSGFQVEVPVGYFRVGEGLAHWKIHWTVALQSQDFQ